MTFDWTTFALELVNFVVLAWILQRLLYRPVMGAIGRRREAIERTLAEARAQSLTAAQLKEDYERRAGDWHAERERASASLAHEIENERTRLLEELRAELAREREKQGALERQRLRELERRAERTARERAAAFCARLLQRVANPGLDAAICAMVLEDLARLEPAQRHGLAAASSGDGLTVDITSARPLGEPQRHALVDALGQILGRPPHAVDFHEDPTLIAGVAVGMGAWVLQANLRDELKFFTEAERDAA